jgi:hypothetical protein
VKRRAESQVEAPGQDSFLDVVCNLVGILIVLVMIVAAQAKRGMMAASSATAAATETSIVSEAEAKAAEATAAAIEYGVQELQAKIEQQKLEAAARQMERDQYQVLVSVAEQRLAEHRQQLSAQERERYDLEQELIRSKGELTRLGAMQVSLTKPKPQVLEHLPTPMARTVFGNEIHFRLLNHRLTYVPWEEVLERMKADAKNHVHKLRDAPRVELSLPVIAGFGSRYVLRRSEVEVETRVGTARQTGIELEEVYLVDSEPNLGQPVSEAFAPGAEFRSRLAGAKPQNTTITIWVYPDSFDDFRMLKAELFKLGFLTAARPMPHGKPIAGSPSGSRSSAE